MKNTILEENRAYWSWRAPGYSEINREELTNGRHRRWKECLAGEIAAHFPGRAAETIRVLDIGCHTSGGVRVRRDGDRSDCGDAPRSEEQCG